MHFGVQIYKNKTYHTKKICIKLHFLHIYTKFREIYRATISNTYNILMSPAHISNLL